MKKGVHIIYALLNNREGETIIKPKYCNEYLYSLLDDSLDDEFSELSIALRYAGAIANIAMAGDNILKFMDSLYAVNRKRVCMSIGDKEK